MLHIDSILILAGFFTFIHDLVDLRSVASLPLLLHHHHFMHIVGFGLFLVIFTVWIFLDLVTVGAFLLHLHLLLHVFLLSHLIVHVVDIFSVLHLSACHREGLLIEQGNDTLLTEHKFNHSFSFMLIEIVVIIEALRN